MIGVAAAITVGLAALAGSLRTGRGLVFDGLLAIAIGWAVIALLAGLLLVAARILRPIPPHLAAIGVAATLFIGYVLSTSTVGPGGYPIVAVFIVGGALVGAGVASLRRRVAIAAGWLVVGTGLVVGVSLWLAAGHAEPEWSVRAVEGPYSVSTLTYGSGQHPHRAAYGQDVDVVTPTVDGTALLAAWSGWRGDQRTSYWGFGPDRLPLNARVWLPSDGPAGPLVLVAHGNAMMEVASDEGYEWLGEHLASHGYVVASIDQNFLNGSVTRGWGDLGDDVDARAWLLLEHLRLWRSSQDDHASPLHGIADLERIAVIGHSRGGEAAAHAAHFDRLEGYPEDARITFDAGFGIDVVVAIAPSDRQYEPAGRATALHDVSYLTLHGGRDGDNTSFVGLRQYARTTFSGETDATKAAVYIEDANHGQFNTVWGRRDAAGIAGRALKTARIMPGDAQRHDGRTAILALLDAAFRDDRSGLALLRDGAHPGWSGTSRVISRYADSTDLLVAGFDEDADPATASLPGATLVGQGLTTWREGPAQLRWGGQDTTGAVIGWDRPASSTPASFTVQLPARVALPPDPVLLLDIADLGGTGAGSRPSPEPPDATVIVDGDGITMLRTSLAHHGGVPPAPELRGLKEPLPDAFVPLEPIARTIRIPLSLAPDDGDVREIRLVFDRTPTGVIRIERIAIGAD